MAPEQPYGPNTQRMANSRVLPTQHGASRRVPAAEGLLVDRLVNQLDRLTLVVGHVLQVRAAYTDLVPNTSPARRPEFPPSESPTPTVKGIDECPHHQDRAGGAHCPVGPDNPQNAGTSCGLRDRVVTRLG